MQQVKPSGNLKFKSKPLLCHLAAFHLHIYEVDALVCFSCFNNHMESAAEVGQSETKTPGKFRATNNNED